MVLPIVDLVDRRRQEVDGGRKAEHSPGVTQGVDQASGQDVRLANSTQIRCDLVNCPNDFVNMKSYESRRDSEQSAYGKERQTADLICG